MDSCKRSAETDSLDGKVLLTRADFHVGARILTLMQLRTRVLPKHIDVDGTFISVCAFMRVLLLMWPSLLLCVVVQSHPCFCVAPWFFSESYNSVVGRCS